jgi:putative ABC transport system permease protein
VLRNYFNIAFRNLWKQKVLSLINVLGLALGIAASTIIIQYVSFELNYDNFHENADRTFRLTIKVIVEGNPLTNSAALANGYGPEFKRLIPEIEDQIRIHRHTDNYTLTVDLGNDLINKFAESRVYYTDSSFFSFFSFPLIKGNKSTVLAESNSAVLSERIAEKYYGKDWRKMPDLLDKSIIVDSKDDHGAMPFKITGVFASMPNSHFQPDILLSYRTLIQKIDPFYNVDFRPSWFVFYTYLQIRPNSSTTDVIEKIQEYFKREWVRAAESGITWDIQLQPMKDIYFHSHYPDELQASGNPNLIYFLIIIAVFILVVAWFNYINLAIVQAIKKTRDTGIRKTMGASRSQLIWQNLVESFLMNIICIIIALVIIQCSGSIFRAITSKAFIPDKFGLIFWFNGQPSVLYFILVITGILLLSTIISGLYPAMFLSRFKTAYMLKGWDTLAKLHKLKIRTILVTLQFMIAAIMMMGTFIVYQQLIFMLREKPGFDNEQVLIFRLLGLNRPDNQIASNSIFLKSEIQKLPLVEDVTTSSSIPGKAINSEHFIWGENEIPITTKTIHVDENFFHFYNLEFLAGRQFPPNAITDTAITQYVVIINEALMQKLGYKKPEDAIGQKFSWPPREILGVIKNYHHGSFHNDYIPIDFSPEGDVWFHSRLGHLLFPDAYTIFSIKLKTSGENHTEISNAIQKISSLFKTTFPDMLSEYYFLDEFYNRQYVKDISYSKLITIFSLLAIFISCFGLFGLSLFMIRQRTKEIGIRKALGASTESLFNLLSKKYLSLVLIASILSIPIAWWGLKQWLQQYAFRIDLQWWYFVLPILLTLLIALISVGYQTIKATLANPVEALRYE